MKKLSQTLTTLFLGVCLGVIVSNSSLSVSPKQAHADGSGLNPIHSVGDELKTGLTNKDQAKLQGCMDTSFCQRFRRMKSDSKVINVVYHRSSARKLDANTATFLIEMERNGIVTLSRATLKKKNGSWKITSIK